MELDQKIRNTNIGYRNANIEIQSTKISSTYFEAQNGFRDGIHHKSNGLFRKVRSKLLNFSTPIFLTFLLS